jgi:hypothetical protein
MRLFLIVILLMGVPALAQAPLTELESLKLEKAQLLDIIEQQMGQIAELTQKVQKYELLIQGAGNKQYRDTLIKEIEAQRPGFTLDPAKGTFSPKAK